MQERGLRFKTGKQICLYHAYACVVYYHKQWLYALNSTVSSSKNPGMLLIAKIGHPQYICNYFLENVQICN